jgi:hypothetical protein
MKKNFRSIGPLLLSSWLLAGCSTTITNLTPSTQPASPTRLYPFEAIIDIHQHAIRRDSLQPYVLIEGQAYPMRREPKLKDRWETLVPIPPNREFVDYQYKVNYKCSALGGPNPGSKLSPPYQVQIVEK